MERLNQLKILLGISPEDVTKDEVLILELSLVERQIINFINCETLPSELETPLVFICAAYHKQAASGTEETPQGAVSSVSRGDVSVSFSATSGASGAAGTYDLGDGGSFFGWRATLVPFRKLRW